MKFLTNQVTIDYTNYKGTRKTINIRPLSLEWASNEWYPEPQWLINALDLDKGQLRTYALTNIHSWKPRT